MFYKICSEVLRDGRIVFLLKADPRTSAEIVATMISAEGERSKTALLGRPRPLSRALQPQSSRSGGCSGQGIAVRDLLLSIFSGIANARSASSQRLSELNSALAQAPGLLRVHKNSDQIETEWTSEGDGTQQVLFAILTSAAELLASDRTGRIRECASAIAHGCSSTRAVTAADAGAT